MLKNLEAKMSRILSYRVWDNEKKEYSDNTFSLDQYGLLYIQDEDGYWEEANEDRFIIEFNTGLEDKNGKMVYEGNIVRWLDGLNEYIEFKVEWQDNRARFCLRNEYSVFDYEDLNDKKKPYIEVIGNVHENGGEE